MQHAGMQSAINAFGDWTDPPKSFDVAQPLMSGLAKPATFNNTTSICVFHCRCKQSQLNRNTDLSLWSLSCSNCTAPDVISVCHFGWPMWSILAFHTEAHTHTPLYSTRSHNRCVRRTARSAGAGQRGHGGKTRHTVYITHLKASKAL